MSNLSQLLFIGSKLFLNTGIYEEKLFMCTIILGFDCCFPTSKFLLGLDTLLAQFCYLKAIQLGKKIAKKSLPGCTFSC